MIAIAPMTYGDAAAAEAIEAAAAGGFEAVGLRLVEPRRYLPEALRVPDAAGLSAAAAALRSAGLAVLEIEAAWLMPATDVRLLRPALAAGAFLGARHLVINIDDPEPGRVRDRLGILTEDAAAHGIRVMLEFLPYTTVRDLAAAVALAHAAGLGVVVDALHLARSGGDPAELAAVPPGLVAHAQICDAPAEAPPFAELRAEAIGERRYPGEGALPLRALLRALPPGTPLSLEVPRSLDAGLSPRERAIRAGAAFRAWLAEAA
ncbi:TIM barrel protein [Falsiroseomonas sp. HW251]|uniref:TIM barrel protein n=1 Tax=Falsiroseomonas sp. HW251 TaxID=3390998 RepID=UPI003D3198DD